MGFSSDSIILDLLKITTLSGSFREAFKKKEKREGALQSQARAEIELRGNCSIRSLGDSKLETGNGTLDLGCWRFGD